MGALSAGPSDLARFLGTNTSARATTQPAPKALTEEEVRRILDIPLGAVEAGPPTSMSRNEMLGISGRYSPALAPPPSPVPASIISPTQGGAPAVDYGMFEQAMAPAPDRDRMFLDSLESRQPPIPPVPASSMAVTPIAGPQESGSALIDEQAGEPSDRISAALLEFDRARDNLATAAREAPVQEGRARGDDMFKVILDKMQKRGGKDEPRSMLENLLDNRQGKLPVMMGSGGLQMALALMDDHSKVMAERGDDWEDVLEVVGAQTRARNAEAMMRNAESNEQSLLMEERERPLREAERRMGFELRAEELRQRMSPEGQSRDEKATLRRDRIQANRNEARAYRALAADTNKVIVALNNNLGSLILSEAPDAEINRTKSALEKAEKLQRTRIAMADYMQTYAEDLADLPVEERIKRMRRAAKNADQAGKQGGARLPKSTVDKPLPPPDSPDKLEDGEYYSLPDKTVGRWNAKEQGFE
jgi:hypothetical protein